MYGLIHKELRSMILDNYGEDTWGRVLKESGVPEDSFLTMRAYDDSVAYDLVGACSKVLALPAEACLEAFGRYWLLCSAPRTYESLLDVTGQAVFEFLENLDALHDRITTTFIDYRPPTFRVERQNENRAQVHYISTRQGLSPFVAGLLAGIGERFGVGLEILDTEKVPVDTGEHTVFTIAVEAKDG